jgi:hypothetical protein
MRSCRHRKANQACIGMVDVSLNLAASFLWAGRVGRALVVFVFTISTFAASFSGGTLTMVYELDSVDSISADMVFVLQDLADVPISV